MLFRSISLAYCTPAVVDWLLAQRRGQPSVTAPLLSISSPTTESRFTTGSTVVDLAGLAEAPDSRVTQVTWENTANGARGTASGSGLWTANRIPLEPDSTNLIILTGVTTSWSPVFGGNTTFNDTLEVIDRKSTRLNSSH